MLYNINLVITCKTFIYAFILLIDLVDPSVYPEFVLAIHSSKRLLVEQVSPPSFVLADTIINLTLAKGQRHEVSLSIDSLI